MKNTKTGIHTLKGVVSPSDIGIIDAHGHIFIKGGMPVLKYPDFKLNDLDKIKREVSEYVDSGGSAIVEMSPIDWGRDAVNMSLLSEEINIHIIASTGFHKLSYYEDIHWVYDYTEDQLISLVKDELLVGLDIHNYKGPIVERLNAKAGVMKVGTRDEPFNATEEKLLHVIAEVHKQTNAPIITHTEEGAMAIEQAKYLINLGVSPRRLALSHIDRMLDINFHIELAKTGVYIIYDAFTRVSKGFHKTTMELIKKMIEKGYGSQLLLGSDISRQGYWRSYNGNPGLKYLPDDYYKLLLKEGIPSEQLDQIFIKNPTELLIW